MSNKRRRKPTTGYREAKPREPEPEPERPGVPGFLGWLSRPSADSPWPTIPSSLGKGFVAVGSSLVLLVASFVLVLAMWIGLVALGLAGPSGRLVNMLALPPISTYFDALNGVTIYGFGPQGFVAASVFLLVRSVLLALLTGMVVQTLDAEGSPVDGLRRGVRAIPVAVAVNLLALAMMVVGSIVLPVLGAGIGFLASVLTLVAALFLFVFAPILAVREPERPIYEVIRRGARAALLPGSRHLLMCLLYIFLTLPILVALAPGGALLGVNPTLAAWIYALLCTYLHLAFLAAFAYRLMAVESEIPEQPLRLRRR
jgi:hypothetical protein